MFKSIVKTNFFSLEVKIWWFKFLILLLSILLCSFACFNSSLSLFNELITFVKANPEFTFEGYVTEPEERNGETRFNLTGISAPASSDNVANLYMWINDERNLFIEPTELDDDTGDIRAWWD